MHGSWLEQRPHLKGLATKMQSLLEFADEIWRRGRASGDGVEYERFEEDVAQRSADIECAVHEVAHRLLPAHDALADAVRDEVDLHVIEHVRDAVQTIGELVRLHCGVQSKDGGERDSGAHREQLSIVGTTARNVGVNDYSNM